MKYRMNGLFLAVVFWIIIVSNAYSQQFTGGIAAGLAGSQVDGDTYSGYNKAGLTAGGWVNISFSDRSAFQMGLNYIQKGSRHNPDTLNISQSLLIKLSYVEMPFLYQYKMKNKFFIETGPSLGVMLSHSEVRNGMSVDVPFRLLDLGWQFGVGYRINEALKVGIRSGNSVSSIRKGEETGYRRRFWDFGQYNNVLAIELSYTL